jgi:hypothetical protein
MELQLHPDPARKLSTKLYDIYHCWVYSEYLLMMDTELSETCGVSFQNKFEKLVHLVGFIIRNIFTMHGHMSRCTVTCHDAWSYECKKNKYFRPCNLARWHFSTKQHKITIKLKGSDVTPESQAGRVSGTANLLDSATRLRNYALRVDLPWRLEPPSTPCMSSKENSMHYYYKFNQALVNVFRISTNETTDQIGHVFLVAYDLRSTKRRDFGLGSKPWQWHQLQFMLCCHVHEGPVSLSKGRSTVRRVLLLHTWIQMTR